MSRKKNSYSIFDELGCCVGRWDGNWHYVLIFDCYKTAKKTAIELKIPNFQIGTASNALMATPSKHSCNQ